MQKARQGCVPQVGDESGATEANGTRRTTARSTRVPAARCPAERLATCIARLYTVIRSFRHKGLERFFREGSKAGIQAAHASRLRLQLGRLDAAASPADMNLPGWRLHPLKGELQGFWAVSVSGNWRLTFAFEGEDAVLVDYVDYH